MPKQVIVSWSGGKDSALTLQHLSRDPSVSVAGLLTTVTRGYDRISIHGVRRRLLTAQARQLGYPLFEAEIEPSCTNEQYEAAFRSALSRIRDDALDVDAIAFGDLFLADVRAYRETFFAGSGFTPVFPLWGCDTRGLADRFISDGYAAKLVCVDTTQLDAGFAGRAFDEQLLADLPVSVDPCGERGEFHTFVSDGPIFANPVDYTVGQTVLRDERFMFCDLE
jgi:uncharacterized protein (TIGR00290 family)